MGELVYKYARVCYNNGNPITGKKLYELQAFCNCDACLARKRWRKEPRNMATFTIEDTSKVSAICEFIKNWTCKDGTKNIKTEYFSF